MSSEVVSSAAAGGELIAAAVALPVAVAFGAGWMAWQAGKQVGKQAGNLVLQVGNLAQQAGNLLAEANDAVDQIGRASCRERVSASV